MSDFVVSGGRALRGTVMVGGSKNAALPIIFAAVATHGVSVLENVPDISDVDAALLLISALGARISRSGTTLTLDTRTLSYSAPQEQVCRAIRASTYLIGAQLARFGMTEIAPFGGCNFEPRPIDLHLYAAKCMGAYTEGSMLRLDVPASSRIFFRKISVGATANALILASSLPTKTEIFGYAREPHIRALADFLSLAGAKIEFTNEKISVDGAFLHGAHAVIPPDPIETGTYALLSLVTGGGINVIGAPEGEISALLEPLADAGAELAHIGRGFTLRGEIKKEVSFTAAPFPALATDIQPFTVPVLARYRGGDVKDTVFPGRFGYVSELAKFGVRAERTSRGVTVHRSRFCCATAQALDLRGGASLLFPALIAQGESKIVHAELIKRGYTDVLGRLRSLGAAIYEL